MTFPVAEPAWRRLKRALTGKRAGFLICATCTGQTLAINLSAIQVVHFLKKRLASTDQVKAERSTALKLHFLGRDSVSFHVDDPVDLANIFTTLKANVQGEHLTFADTNGDLIVFSTRDLILLETSTTFVEEGFLKAHEQRRHSQT